MATMEELIGRQGSAGSMERVVGQIGGGQPEPSAAPEEQETDLASLSRRAGVVNEKMIETFRRAAFSFGTGFNQAMSSILGLPGDAKRALNRATAPLFNLTDEELQILNDATLPSSEEIAASMSQSGVAETDPSRVTGGPVGAMVEAGRETGFAVPGLGAAGGAALGRSMAQRIAPPAGGVRQFGRNVLETAQRAPGAFAAGEVGAATGAGIGANVMEGTGPVGEAAGLIGGSFAGGLGGAALAAPRAVGSTIRSLTPSGQRRDVARVIQGQATDPRGAVRNLRNAPDVPLTGAQASQDPGLLALERSVISGNASLEGRFDDLAGNLDDLLSKEIRSVVSGSQDDTVTRQFFQGRIDKATELVDERILQAREFARQQIDAIGPDIEPKDASKIVRQEIESAFDAVKAQERAFWNAIGMENQVSVKPVRDALTSIVQGKKKAFKLADLVPEELVTTIRDDFGDLETVDEILSFRSKLNQIRRDEAAKAVTNNRLLSNLSQLDDAALTALSTLDDGQSQAVRAALDFSRTVVNDQFRRGPLGRVLGFERSGGARVSPEGTLFELIRPASAGQTALRSGESVRAIRGAAGAGQEALEAVNTETIRQIMQGAGPENVDNAMRQFIRGQFQMAAVDPDSGTLNANAAKQFLRKHETVLDELPELRRELRQAVDAGESLDFVQKIGTSAKRNIAKTRASAFIQDEDAGRAINRILASRKPEADMKSLVSSARKDGTGQALMGLQNAFVENMMGRTILGRPLFRGNRVQSGTKITEFLDKNQGAIRALFDKDQISRIRQAARQLSLFEQSLRPGVRGGSDTAPKLTMFQNAIARTIGARIGAQIGPRDVPSLQRAQIGSNAFRRFITSIKKREYMELMEEAIFDPNVLETLLTEVTPDTEDLIMQKLRGHLISLGFRAAEEEEDEGLVITITPEDAGGQ